MKRFLSIAGFDPSGGAGIIADVKVAMRYGLYGMAAVTSVVDENTHTVYGQQNIDPDLLRNQIEHQLNDIGADVVKIGLVANAEQVRVIADCLRRHAEVGFVVYDPVMVSSSGRKMVDDDLIEAVKECLLPLLTVVTPNLSEAECLFGRGIETNENDLVDACRMIRGKGDCAVVVTGGDAAGDELVDYIYCGNELLANRKARTNTVNKHGTGCTFSSAVACNLANGKGVVESILDASEFIRLNLEKNAGVELGLGKGATLMV